MEVLNVCKHVAELGRGYGAGAGAGGSDIGDQGRGFTAVLKQQCVRTSLCANDPTFFLHLVDLPAQSAGPTHRL